MPTSITGDLADLMPDVVAHRAVTARDHWGTPTAWSTSQNLQARVKGHHRLVRDATGRERVSTVQAIVGSAVTVDVGDEFVLPARFSPRTPPAISIEFVPDENGAHHVVINF